MRLLIWRVRRRQSGWISPLPPPPKDDEQAVLLPNASIVPNLFLFLINPRVYISWSTC